MSFRHRVLAAVRRIPRGRVATYGDIAALAGSPRAARAVGTVMRECRDPGVPCHRVIGAAGALGGYGDSLHVKRDRLRAEGLEVGPGRVRRFAEVRWPAVAAPVRSPKRRSGTAGPSGQSRRSRRGSGGG